MPMKLVDGRFPETVGELSTVQQEQLFETGKAFDGMERPAALRFETLTQDNPFNPEPDDDDDDWWDDGCLVAHHLSVWKVMVDGGYTYDLWVHHSDNGSLFKAGTAERVAGRYQSTWLLLDAETDFPEAAALDEAMKDAEVW